MNYPGRIHSSPSSSDMTTVPLAVRTGKLGLDDIDDVELEDDAMDCPGLGSELEV